MKIAFLPVLLITILSCTKKDEYKGINREYTPPPEGTVIKDGIVNSVVLGMGMHYAVYLPPGYDTSDVDYPVLYLLHGMGGNYMNWVDMNMELTLNYAIKEGNSKPLIVIMPDGMDAFYCNNYNGEGIMYEDFFIQEFIPAVESTYRIKADRENRAIAGLSMGGYGTTFHAFKRPEMFCYAYSMSGALDMGNAAPDLRAIINSYSEEQLSDLPGYTMECGTEDFLYSVNTSFADFLSSKGIAYTFITRSGGHSWTFWIECLPNTLIAVSDAFE